MIDQVGHFGVSRGLKFESDVEGVALAGGLGSRVNAIPSQGTQGWFAAEVYSERGNVGHGKRGGGTRTDDVLREPHGPAGGVVSQKTGR